MAETKHTKQREEQSARPAEPESAAYRAHVPADIRNITFPVGMRGYERDAVEAYVRRVNRVIAELEVTRSPQAAVKHAVERVSEQTKTILEEARESAEKITTTAQTEADEIVAQAKAKAADLVVAASSEADRVKAESDELVARSREQAEAEARMRELEADTASVWDRRHELLGDIDRMADQLHEAAREATGRFARASSETDEQTGAEETAILPAKTATD